MKITSAEFVKGIVGTNDILYDGMDKIAFVGRSNVGKSSLINSLVNRKDLVKTGNKPGKTTEINFFRINGKFYFVDLPGYGYAQLSPDRKEHIEKMMRWFLVKNDQKPSKVVMVLDAKVGFTEFDRGMLKILYESGIDFVIAANKIDKLNNKELQQAFRDIVRESGIPDIVPYSAWEKTGRDELLKRIFQKPAPVPVAREEVDEGEEGTE
jgi:GTP-binding protein